MKNSCHLFVFKIYVFWRRQNIVDAQTLWCSHCGVELGATIRVSWQVWQGERRLQCNKAFQGLQFSQGGSRKHELCPVCVWKQRGKPHTARFLFLKPDEENLRAWLASTTKWQAISPLQVLGFRLESSMLLTFEKMKMTIQFEITTENTARIYWKDVHCTCDNLKAQACWIMNISSCPVTSLLY